VPEWGGDAIVWQMPENRRSEFDAWNKELAEDQSKTLAQRIALFNGRLVADTVGDEQGALVFTHDDIPALLEKSSEVVRRLSAAAFEVNRMGRQAEEDAVKNSGSDLDGCSPSTSQES